MLLGSKHRNPLSGVGNASAHRAALIAWAAALALVTLRPGVAVGDLPWWSLGGGSLAGVDAIANVLLFTPLGWNARRLGWRMRSAAAAGAIISLLIEVAQIFIPGRTSILGDVLLNTAGALIGAWLAGDPGTVAARRTAVYALWLAGVLMLVLDLHLPSAGTAAAPPDSRTRCSVAPPVEGAWCQHLPLAPVGEPQTLSGNDVRIGVRWLPATSLSQSAGHRCVDIRHATQLSMWRLRPPRQRSCAPVRAGAIAIWVHPAIRSHVCRQQGGTVACSFTGWSPALMIWPVWQWGTFRPNLLRVLTPALALGLVVLLTGQLRWYDAAAWLVLLWSAPIAAPLLTRPDWFDAAIAVGWAVVLWAVGNLELTRAQRGMAKAATATAGAARCV